jgi:ATP-dependent Clp protease ATP-binding subunit ClpA
LISNVVLNFVWFACVFVQVSKHFRLELLNRLREIVIFDPLSNEQLKKLARLQILSRLRSTGQTASIGAARALPE